MHCTGGADRTGTAVFLLHAILGVSELECIQGYELTSFSYYGLRNTQGNYQDKFDPFLARIATFDGNTLQEKIESWVLSIGVTQAQIDNIRAIFRGEVAVDAPELYNLNTSASFSAAPKGATADIRLNMSQLLVKKDED